MIGLCQSMKYSAPSGPIFGVDRAEVRVGRLEDRLDLGRLQPGAVLAQLVLEDALEADDVEHEQVALHRLGEVPAREDLHAADRARAHAARLRRSFVSIAG